MIESNINHEAEEKISEAVLNRLYIEYCHKCKLQEKEIEETKEAFSKGILGLYEQWEQDSNGDDFYEYCLDYINTYLRCEA